MIRTTRLAHAVGGADPDLQDHLVAAHQLPLQRHQAPEAVEWRAPRRCRDAPAVRRCACVGRPADRPPRRRLRPLVVPPALGVRRGEGPDPGLRRGRPAVAGPTGWAFGAEAAACAGKARARGRSAGQGAGAGHAQKERRGRGRFPRRPRRPAAATARRCGRPRPGPGRASGRRTCRSCSDAPVSSKTKLSWVVSTTLARKMSATRRASTRSTPVPRTFTSASSRSMPLGSLVTSCTWRVETIFCSWASICDSTCRRAAGDDGDAAGVRVAVGLGHRQAVDVVAARGEQPDHPVQHPRLVVHQHGEGGAALLLLGVGEVVDGGGLGGVGHGAGS